MPNPLLTEADKLAALTEAVSKAYATELGRVLRDLERELVPLVVEAKAGDPTALMRAVRAGKLRKQVIGALDRAGYGALAARYSDASLDAVVAQVGRLRGAAKLAAFVTTDDAKIVALKKLASIDLLQQGAEIAHAAWRTLAQGIFTQRPTRVLLEDLADALDTELKDARRIYDTTVNIFSRQVEAMKSKGAPDEPFAYMGPVDDKTREFCLERVGKVFTRSQIEQMDNGQLPNVFLSGGGYNCRHQFIAVSKFGDAGKLVGTGERLPEVARQMEAVAA